MWLPKLNSVISRYVKYKYKALQLDNSAQNVGCNSKTVLVQYSLFYTDSSGNIRQEQCSGHVIMTE